MVGSGVSAVFQKRQGPQHRSVFPPAPPTLSSQKAPSPEGVEDLPMTACPLFMLLSLRGLGSQGLRWEEEPPSLPSVATSSPSHSGSGKTCEEEKGAGLELRQLRGDGSGVWGGLCPSSISILPLPSFRHSPTRRSGRLCSHGSASLPLRLMDLAKEMTKEALPIKCLEAVILGMYPSSALGGDRQLLSPSGPRLPPLEEKAAVASGPPSNLSQQSSAWPQTKGP